MTTVLDLAAAVPAFCMALVVAAMAFDSRTAGDKAFYSIIAAALLYAAGRLIAFQDIAI